MSKRRLTIVYALLVAVPLFAILAMLRLEPPVAIGTSTVSKAVTQAGSSSVSLVTLLLQVAAIVITARLTGMLFRLVGQPRVMGEIVAGILLGPSLLGWALPGVSAALFPSSSMPFLNILSQLGLLLFLFQVGLEFNTAHIRGLGRAALLISHASISIPFALGSALAFYLYPRLADPAVPFPAFLLFLGAAMSVTAFPVLARILAERQMTRSELGVMAIACAAVDDVSAWCILAGLVAFVRAGQEARPLWYTLPLLAVFVAFMIGAVRPALRRFVAAYRAHGRITDDLMALLLLLLFLSASATEWLGIHLLFGAFLFGAILPRDPAFIADLMEKLESVTVVLLLPLFFAFSGLRTSVGLLHGPEMWFFCALVTLVAIAGKFGGSSLAAWLGGIEPRRALALGALMNTRGLMELVILNVGLDLGVLSPELFSMMVLMALATTALTGPLLDTIQSAGETAVAAGAEHARRG